MKGKLLGWTILSYIARPPISTDRLTLDERGRILYRLRHPYRDGTTHIVFTPTSFLERLCALIPRPCKHLLTYHGVLAPASSWRPEIIPRGAFESVPGTSRPTTRTSLERRLRWAELIRRVFDADVLHCECGARRRVIATITRSASGASDPAPPGPSVVWAVPQGVITAKNTNKKATIAHYTVGPGVGQGYDADRGAPLSP